MGARKIDTTLLDSELLGLINASAKIFPIPYADILANINTNDYEYVKPSDSAEHNNEIYRWDVTVWELIGAEDSSIDWSDIDNKPTEFAPVPHTHTQADIPTIPTALSQLSEDTTHRTVTDADKAVWDTVVSKSDSAHTHDGRYYTEAEMTAFLAAKQETLVNQTNIKSINGVSLLGTGDIIAVSGGDMYKTTYDTNSNNQVDIADVAVKLQTPRNINGIAFDGSANITVADGTKEPVINKASAFNQAFETSTANILMDGAVSVGTSSNIPRADHRHASDTTKQNTLVSGTSIKTINSTTLLGSGDIAVAASQAAGSATSGAAAYSGTTRTAGNFYGGTTNPSSTTRENYDGYIYATRLYSGAIQVATLTGTETLTAKTLTAPKMTSASNIADSAGNELINFPATVASATNNIQVNNSANGVAPSIQAVGSADANINLNLVTKGTGVVTINGSKTIAETITRGTVQPTDGTLWFKEV